jgi:hypothetical protein
MVHPTVDGLNSLATILLEAQPIFDECSNIISNLDRRCIPTNVGVARSRHLSQIRRSGSGPPTSSPCTEFQLKFSSRGQTGRTPHRTRSRLTSSPSHYLLRPIPSDDRVRPIRRIEVSREESDTPILLNRKIAGLRRRQVTQGTLLRMLTGPSLSCRRRGA